MPIPVDVFPLAAGLSLWPERRYTGRSASGGSRRHRGGCTEVKPRPVRGCGEWARNLHQVEHMRGRFYSPAWHCFLNPDQGADPNQLNQYAYCGGNPMMRTDPSGMSWLSSLIHGLEHDVHRFGHAMAVNWDNGLRGDTELAAALVGSYFLGPWVYSECGGGVLGGMAAGGATGAYSGAITGGNLRTVAKDAVIGAAIGGAVGYWQDYQLQQAQQYGRPLTDNEIFLAQQQPYGDSIDYSQVRVVNTNYWFGQQDGMAITPNGNIYMANAPADFTDSLTDKSLFIHEMTHVYQYQEGVNVLLKGMGLQMLYYGTFKLYDVYRYSTPIDRPFSSYNIEQQGDMVSNWFFGN